MGVELTDDITDGACGLFVFGAGFESQLAHGVDNAALHRFQPVTDVRQGTVENHVHRIVEVGFLGVILQG